MLEGVSIAFGCVTWNRVPTINRNWTCSLTVACGADPGTDALLPDLLPFQKQVRMRTLVLDLDGVLVQSVWQRKHGWKTVKRPGVEPFLETMAQYFEVVVFSDRSHSYADPILNRVDPGIVTNQGPVLMYRLYKNSTQWRVRSLSCVRPRPNVELALAGLHGLVLCVLRARELWKCGRTIPHW
jgi:mitochondrial import inner membrane translocase subunit TIM50